MDFLIQWLWYLLAFVAGSALAGLIGVRLARRANDEQVPADEMVSTDPGGGR